ncbi:MAG: hypothetical protein AAGG01_12430 [Planctomycetota bacterium]
MPNQPVSAVRSAESAAPVLSSLPQVVLFTICALTLLVGLSG